MGLPHFPFLLSFTFPCSLLHLLAFCSCVGSLPVIPPSFLVYFSPWLRCRFFHFYLTHSSHTTPPSPFHPCLLWVGIRHLNSGSLYDIVGEPYAHVRSHSLYPPFLLVPSLFHVENGMFLRTDIPEHGVEVIRTDFIPLVIWRC